MSKVKLIQGELKKQRDALRQYERYLPTLQLKKQQLQIEILHQAHLLEEIRLAEEKKVGIAQRWSGLLNEPKIGLGPWLKTTEVITSARNIAGVDIPVFENVRFPDAEYDLFLLPLWVDAGLGALREIVGLREELAVIQKGIDILKHELRITTQRVNLFEKVKIPEAQEAIRLIKIYLGDQMTNAVGRSKIAKRKIEEVSTLSLVS